MSDETLFSSTDSGGSSVELYRAPGGTFRIACDHNDGTPPVGVTVSQNVLDRLAHATSPAPEVDVRPRLRELIDEARDAAALTDQPANEYPGADFTHLADALVEVARLLGDEPAPSVATPPQEGAPGGLNTPELIASTLRRWGADLREEAIGDSAARFVGIKLDDVAAAVELLAPAAPPAEGEASS